MATDPAQAPRQPRTRHTPSSTTHKESGTGEQPRLDSWKEIANYLRRSVRTVRRWEREEGLPVHRHHHGKQGTIFALSAEIDEWLSGRSAKPGPPSVVQINPPLRRIAAGTDPADQPSRPIMIAVLPLRNLSEEAGHDSFADGLTDELITEIGHCCPDRLRVIGLTSVMQYKQSSKSIEQIGQELGVDYVLEGGVRRRGRRVRLTARLLAARDQAHIWADSYETQLPPVFSLQQTLARRVAYALSTELKVTPSSSWHRPITLPNVVAHDAYLEGRSHFLPTEGDSTKSIEHLNLAIERDPRFAPSYAELSLAYFRRLFWDFPPVVTFKRIEEYASKALKLDPKLARAHSMLAAFHLFGAWSWSKAERSSRLAIKLNPSDPWAQIVRAAFHLVVGELQEAIEGLNRVRQLDPQSQETGVWCAIFAYFARHYDLAIEHCREVLQLDPSSAFVHMVLGLNLAQINEYAPALSHCEKALAVSDRSVSQISRACSIYALTGEQQSGEKLYDALVTMKDTQYTRHIFLAQASVCLHKDEQTLEWLERAYEQRDPLLVFLKADPRFDSISANPRFRELLGRIELLGEQEREAAAHIA